MHVQRRKAGEHTLSGVGLGIGKLYAHFFPAENFSGKNGSMLWSILATLLYELTAHRALPDVQAMKRLFEETPLAGFFSAVPIRTSTQQVNKWLQQKGLFQRSSLMIKKLGKPCITTTQAKRLDTLGFNHDALVNLWRQIPDPTEFMDELKKKGVNSNPLRIKLTTLVKQLK